MSKAPYTMRLNLRIRTDQTVLTYANISSPTTAKTEISGESLHQIKQDSSSFEDWHRLKGI